jgi:hypothetical protein
MASYNDSMLDRIAPSLLTGEREHIFVVQDETVFHTNEYRRHMWLTSDQQPIRKKGNGQAIHVSDFISETIGQIKLSKDQIADQLNQPAGECLSAFEARKIIYPGKGFDAWWDLPQLIEQLKVTIKIFELTHPNCTVVFTFDQSSAHKGFAEDALNVNKMNVQPTHKQSKLHDTIILFSNPDPVPNEEDTHGQIQHMCFPIDHPYPDLKDKPKGMKVVLEERKSVWDKFTMICREHGKKIVRKCGACMKSNAHKDKERHIATAEAMDQGDVPLIEEMPSYMADEWCCMHKVLSLQEDF